MPHRGGRQRYLRIDTAADGSKTRTWYVGGVEIVEKPNEILGKRYLGGVAVFTQALTAAHSSNGTAPRMNYLHKDHLGSTDVITDQNGAIVQQFSFDAFGKQRSVANWSALVNPTIPLNQSGAAIIARGFTGHEHIDEMGLIHMNGRIYDPSLGRFVQADPEIQEPFNLQNLNRYSYVVNNPLSYTDPSGFNFLKKWGRFIIAAVVVYFTMGAATVWAAGWLAGTALAGNAIAIGAIAGAISGAVGGAIMTGTVKGAFTGALTGAIGGAFGGYAQGLDSAASQMAANAAAGGINSVIQGGKFGHGFVSAGFVSAAGNSDMIKNLKAPTAKIFSAALVGGTASRLSGGKFENGAVSGAFQAIIAEGAGNIFGKKDRNVEDVETGKYTKQNMADLKDAKAYVLKEYPGLIDGRNIRLADVGDYIGQACPFEGCIELTERITNGERRYDVATLVETLVHEGLHHRVNSVMGVGSYTLKETWGMLTTLSTQGAIHSWVQGQGEAAYKHYYSPMISPKPDVSIDNARRVTGK